jgi:hypothetical protein
MSQHAVELPTLDRTKPLMLQLDLLTPAQVRSAALSLDPLAASRAP